MASRKSGISKHYLVKLAFLSGAEAYFESFCQLVLQAYTILNRSKMTNIQLVTILFSAVQVARTSITTDIEMQFKNEEMEIEGPLCFRNHFMNCTFFSIGQQNCPKSFLHSSFLTGKSQKKQNGLRVILQV